MRVLVAHNYYQQPGGEDVCVAAETALLEAHGHEVIRYFLHNDAIDGMRYRDVAARTIWSGPAYRELRELMRTHRPQIAHFHNTFPLMSPAAYYAARAEDVRIVQTLHNYRLLCPNGSLFRDGRVCEACVGRAAAWPGIVHGCYRGSRAATAAVAAMLSVHHALHTWRDAVDTYIAPTEFTRQKLIQGGLPAHRLFVKPNFVHPDPGPGNGKGGYALFIGRLVPEKGLETLLGAWRILGSHVPLKIVGDGPMAAIVSAAAGTHSGIQWLGQKPAEEVKTLLSEAMFLVVPSQCYETFGRVVVEAFANGTPVIASGLGALAELVDPGRTGLLFQPGDCVDLATQIGHLLATPFALDQMRRDAREEYERKYTAESNYEHLMAIYKRTVNGKSQHSLPAATASALQGNGGSC
jgi:glycosyltransferase involved in cell wall biosynthesis